MESFRRYQLKGLDRRTHKLLSIIIPAKNEARYLDNCLHALHIALESYGGNFEIILVDNGSTDRTTAIARQKNCKVIEEINATLGKMRNVGASTSNGEVLAFLDADCLVDPNWIVYCVEAFKNDKITMVGTRAIPDLANSTWVEKAWYRLVSGAGRPDFVDWLGTSNIFLRRAEFMKLGGFCEKLKTGEDVSLGYQIRKEGGLIYLEKRINTIHMRESKSLIELFRREYWRGQSSIRSYWKNAFSRRELPSVAIPAVNGIAILIFILYLILRSYYAFLPALVIFGLPIIMMRKKRVISESRKEVFQCFIVAMVYLLGRSCSLLYEVQLILKSNFCQRSRIMPQ